MMNMDYRYPTLSITILICTLFVPRQFVKINAEKSPFLCERLNIWMIPSILLVKGSKTVHTMKGLDEMGGDRFTAQQLAFHFSQFGVLGTSNSFVNLRRDG